MNTNRQHTLPKLRFPEFRNTSEWNQLPLSKVFNVIKNGKANAQDHQDDGIYPLFDRSDLIKKSETFLFDTEAVILPGEGMKFQPRYFNGKFNLHQRAYALMDPVVNAIFAFYSLDRFKAHLADSAVKSTVLSLRLPIIKKFSISIPNCSREQQKIAECLTSIDNLIAAQEQKINLLKQHKQGLLQQLFPQDGKTLPKLRFPEFRNTSEWNQLPLSKVFNVIKNGKANAQDHQDDGIYPLFDRSDLIKKSETFLFDTEAVILPGEGMKFQPRYFNGKFNLHQRAYALMDPVVNAIFAFYSLDRFKAHLADSAVKSTVLSLRLPIIKKFSISIPNCSREQQKIAECLTSIDNLIAAQEQKINLLKQHKQGLLQQLFPNLHPK